ncbi:MAG: DUF1989 domain-containing protein [Actinomycetota bacterium]
MAIIPFEKIHLEPQTGCAFEIFVGDTLRVISPTGGQVADLTAFDRSDTAEWLSSGRTIDYNESIYVSTGDSLFSNRSNRMLKIIEDTAGRHDFVVAPCSSEMFERTYGVADHPSCLENLATNLAPFGIRADSIPTTLNLFMTVTPDPQTGRIVIGPPSCGEGDYVTLIAEAGLIVGVAACSAEITNQGVLKPIDLEIHRHPL